MGERPVAIFIDQYNEFIMSLILELFYLSISLFFFNARAALKLK